MLTVTYINGRACPFVYCDSCDDRSDSEGWYALDVFLAFLLRNVEYNARKAKDQVDLLAEIG